MLAGSLWLLEDVTKEASQKRLSELLGASAKIEIKKFGVGPWEEENTPNSPRPAAGPSATLDARGRPQLSFNTAFKRPGPYTPGFSP